MPSAATGCSLAAAWHASYNSRLVAPMPARFRHRSETARRTPRHHRPAQSARLPALALPSRRSLQGRAARPGRVSGRGLEASHRSAAPHCNPRHHRPGPVNSSWPQVRGLGYSEARRWHRVARAHDLDRDRPGRPATIRDADPEEMMTFKSLDPVVLLHDLPTRGLKAGDMGAVVEVYPPDALEVEFVVASGRTKALLTLKVSDVRGIRGSDMLAVRSVGHRS